MLQQVRDGIGRWVAGAILALIAVTFIFWGVDFGLTGATFAARVNGEEIPLVEFERALQAQQAEYADLYRMEFTQDLQLNLRRAVLERLIRNEALLQRVQSAGYGVPDERVMAGIRSRPEFQVDGEFSLDLYRARLLNQAISPAAFEAMQREQLELIELQIGIANSAFYTPAEFRRYVELYKQRREVAYAVFEAAAFTDAVEVSEEAIAAHYEANKAAFSKEESVDLEYIELRSDQLAATVEVTDEALETYYEEERARFETEEQRHARHILFAAGGDPALAERRAEEAMARLTAGEDFEALAQELSEDPGTKDQGGDLGWVSRGLLAGPFEDALYAMEVGDVDGPVETDFGFHIIRLDELREGELRSFEEVRDELLDEYRLRHAEESFYNQATELADRSFDAYDELATVATQLGLPLETFQGFTRSGSSSPFENSAPVVQAAFSPEVLEQGQNSGPIELADDHVVVLRVAAHHLPEEQPLEIVRDAVVEEIVREEAERLAGDAAQAFAERLDSAGELAMLAAELGGEWHEPAWIERSDGSMPTQIVATAFRLGKPGEGDRLVEPVPLASGDFAVLLLSAVAPGDAETVTEEEREQIARALTDQAGMFELTGYAGEIRDAATVRIPDQIINPTF
ncbi:MAG TPA: SurA N-terminal domain-containing protein [Gammaproteobacteria bacterium]|jgi:peptidyl-prolyl cis-trans isomerase D